MTTIFVIPKPGLKVRHEDGRPLAEGGESVERSAYWLRRIRTGDVFQESGDRRQESDKPTGDPPPTDTASSRVKKSKRHPI